MDIKDIFGDVLYTAAVDTVAELVTKAVKERINLYGARLDGASLDGALLDGASLDGARLDGARLDGASLVRARLPAPTVLLLAYWGTVSEQLCADLMEYDCWSHGDRKAFDNYAVTRRCPYDGHLEQRAAHFTEDGSVWAKKIGKLCSPRDLMLRLFAEKGISRK